MEATKAMAFAKGDTQYLTGKLCVNGHSSARRVCDGKCCQCVKAKDALRAEYFSQWRRDNLAKCADYTAAYRERNPGIGATYMANRRATHREEMQTQERVRYAADPAKFAAKGAAYRQAKPEVFATHARNRRSLLKAAEGWHTPQEIEGVMVYQEYQCNNCFVDITNDYHADHIMPLVLGGSNWITNIQLLCPTCNLRKGDLHPDEFANREAA